MKKSIDFSKGIRAKHSEMNLVVLGAADEKWAVCVTKGAKDLIPFKLYRIETFSASDEVRLENEKGEKTFFPKSWFAVVEVSKTTVGLFESVS